MSAPTEIIDDLDADEDDEASFCELLQEVEAWLAESTGDDLCDPRHMYAVGMQLMTTAQLRSNFQFMPASPTIH